MVIVLASWLAALVGGLLLPFASHAAAGPVAVAAARTVVPVVASGLAAAGQAVVIAATTGDVGVLLPAWLAVWLVVLMPSWLLDRQFALLGSAGLLLALPLASLQSAQGWALATAFAVPGLMDARKRCKAARDGHGCTDSRSRAASA